MAFCVGLVADSPVILFGFPRPGGNRTANHRVCASRQGYSFLPKISKPGRSKRICHVFPAFLSYALTVQGDNLSVDGSFIEANANKESRIPREQFSHRTA